LVEKNINSPLKILHAFKKVEESRMRGEVEKKRKSPRWNL
jgi:hypothetical protein